MPSELNFDLFAEKEALTLIEGFYRGFLRRDPDPAGLTFWVSKLLESQDITSILKEFLNSQEYRNQLIMFKRNSTQLVPSLRKDISRAVNILDIGSILIDDEKPIWESLSQHCDINVIGFDPNTEDFTSILKGEFTTTISNYGVALGDGKDHILHINNDVNTSSFYPILPNEKILHLKDIRTISTRLVPTQKLDGLAVPPIIDLLKIDVQGYELEIFKSSLKTLASTGLVYIEVAFSPIYKGQALFHEIDSFLLQNGFQLIDLKDFKYPMTGVENQSSDLIMWGDALYRKIPPSLADQAIQNFILAVLFHKYNLAEFGHIQKSDFESN